MRVRPSSRELLVQDIMTRDVVTLGSRQSLPLAETLMKMRRVRHLPVIDDDARLVGLVTHRDLLAASITNLAPLDEGERSELQLAVPVAQLMQTQVWSIEPTARAFHAAQVLHDHRFGCLPVCEDRVLVGIVTEHDFLGVLLETLDLDTGR